MRKSVFMFVSSLQKPDRIRAQDSFKRALRAGPRRALRAPARTFTNVHRLPLSHAPNCGTIHRPLHLEPANHFFGREHQPCRPESGCDLSRGVAETEAVRFLSPVLSARVCNYARLAVA